MLVEFGFLRSPAELWEFRVRWGTVPSMRNSENGGKADEDQKQNTAH